VSGGGSGRGGGSGGGSSGGGGGSSRMERRWRQAHPQLCYVPAGLNLHLACLAKNKPAELASGKHIKGNVLIDPSAKVQPGSLQMWRERPAPPAPRAQHLLPGPARRPPAC